MITASLVVCVAQLRELIAVADSCAALPEFAGPESEKPKGF